MPKQDEASLVLTLNFAFVKKGIPHGKCTIAAPPKIASSKKPIELQQYSLEVMKGE